MEHVRPRTIYIYSGKINDNCMVEGIECAKDEGEFAEFVICDFSKAFKSIPHELFLRKL